MLFYYMLRKLHLSIEGTLLCKIENHMPLGALYIYLFLIYSLRYRVLGFVGPYPICVLYEFKLWYTVNRQMGGLLISTYVLISSVLSE